MPYNQAFDADGGRVKTVKASGATVYTPFPDYEEELNGAAVIRRSTYRLAGQLVAVRVTGDPVTANNGLFYYHTDHLGSTAVLTKGDGGAILSSSVARYYPFGAYRTAPTATATDREYTGHRHNDDIGLIYMNARFYVPSIGRFLSADTLVPDPVAPQSHNRYSYSLNNPTNYSDPTGHYVAQEDNDADEIPPYHPYTGEALPASPYTEQIAEGVAALGSIAVSLGCEPCDWLMTLDAWRQGDFHWLDIPGFLPIISSTGVRIARNSDAVGDFLRYADDFDSLVPAREVRWLQDNISAHTRIDPMYLDDLAGSISDGWRGAPLRVVEIDGVLYSLDNRRLAAAKVLDIDVPVVVQDLSDSAVLREYNWKRSGLEVGTQGLYVDIKGTNLRMLSDGTVVPR